MEDIYQLFRYSGADGGYISTITIKVGRWRIYINRSYKGGQMENICQPFL